MDKSKIKYMNLKETLEGILKDKPITESMFGVDINTLYGKEQLEQYKELLLQTDTFKDCDELNFLTYPIINIDDKTLVAKSYKWSKDLKFKGKGYLLSLALTPEMYNPDTIHKPVKDGAGITPTLYDIKTFEPKKKIVLEFSPEMIQDQQMANGEAILRQELHDLLDKVLDNPQDYQIKGERGLLIRGLFESSENKSESPSVDLSGVINEEPKYSMVYYLKAQPEDENGNVSMRLENKIIPLELKDKFLEHFGERASSLQLTESEIEEFIYQNTK
jgi:hypothetical protein